MSRRCAQPARPGIPAQARCLRKLIGGASGFQLEIAREPLLIIASVLMTRRFSTT
ncbi:hypothetical protein OKW32_002624 [Paraburkholderia youngii]